MWRLHVGGGEWATGYRGGEGGERRGLPETEGEKAAISCGGEDAHGKRK